MTLSKWAVLLLALTVAAAPFAFVLDVGAMAGLAKALFCLFLAGLTAVCIAAFRSHRRQLARMRVEPLGPTRFPE